MTSFVSYIHETYNYLLLCSWFSLEEGFPGRLAGVGQEAVHQVGHAARVLTAEARHLVTVTAVFITRFTRAVHVQLRISKLL